MLAGKPLNMGAPEKKRNSSDLLRVSTAGQPHVAEIPGASVGQTLSECLSDWMRKYELTTLRAGKRQEISAAGYATTSRQTNSPPSILVFG